MLRLALRKSSIPRLFQIPGPLHLESVFFRQLDVLLAKKNDYWAGSCKKTIEYYRSAGVQEQRLFLAYYGGVKCDEYKPNSHLLHEEFGVPEDVMLVGMVSLFYKPKKLLFQTRGLKGHEDFIDAIALIQKTHPKVKGIIIGDAWGDGQPYVEKVKRYAQTKCSDGIIFAGFRSDLFDVYKELGIDAIISNNITVCSDAVIGAGAVVVKDIERPVTYVGVPANRMNS